MIMGTAKAIYLEWIDSAGYSGWRDDDDISKLVPYTCRTIGLLIRDTDEAYIVGTTETVDMEDAGFSKCYHGIISIPKVAVTTCWELEIDDGEIGVAEDDMSRNDL